MSNSSLRLARSHIFPALAVLLAAIAFVPIQQGCDVRRADEEPDAGDVNENEVVDTTDDEIVSDDKNPQKPGKPLDRGVDYLLKAQDDDGAWRSKTYGQLKGGAAMTALVLYALGHLDEPRGEQVDAAARRALGFLQPGIEKYGYVCEPDDGTPAYSTRSGAMLLVAVDRLKLSLPPTLRGKLIDDLIRVQLTERQGWQPDNMHYGGWDVARLDIATTSDTNVSVSALALEALSRCRHEKKAAVLARARRWAEWCQNIPQDGGFFFSPNTASNKPRSGDDRDSTPRSYGTATCDGLRALVYCGAAADDPRVSAAVAWLADHRRVDEVPGFEPTKVSNRWSVGLVYYYSAMLAKVLLHLPPAVQISRGKQIRDFLAKQQQKDGHWVNDVSRMQEDDPLIATAFAVIALAEVTR